MREREGGAEKKEGKETFSGRSNAFRKPLRDCLTVESTDRERLTFAFSGLLKDTDSMRCDAMRFGFVRFD